MSQYYFPLIEDELLKEGLPSSCGPCRSSNRRSPSRPYRPWAPWDCGSSCPRQAKATDLRSISLVDERRDPVRSTQAACRYLKDLYAIYKDWSLAIAAYNCGPGNVNKALARAGEKEPHLLGHLRLPAPRKTARLRPPQLHGRMPTPATASTASNSPEAPIPLATDTVRIDRIMHLQQIASTIDVPIETLRQLNPQYKLDIIRPRPNPIRWCFRSAA